MTHLPLLEAAAADTAPQALVPALEPPLPGPQSPTARRVAAALIDIALLAGVFVIMAVTVGKLRVAGGSFEISLNGVWALLYAAVTLGYFVTLEAWTGQTVGKRLLGLRVLRTDGSRPSVAAIAGRTLLRIIDGLPALYLVGFITMMATGKRRQRIGDLAADTAVVRACGQVVGSFQVGKVVTSQVNS